MTANGEARLFEYKLVYVLLATIAEYIRAKTGNEQSRKITMNATKRKYIMSGFRVAGFFDGVIWVENNSFFC